MNDRTEKIPRSRFDRGLRVSLAAVGMTGAAMSLTTLALFGRESALSVAIGAAIAAANLWALARIVVALVPADSEGGKPTNAGAWTTIGLTKMLGLLVVVGVLLHQPFVFPLPLLLGLGALPIGIAIGALVGDRGGGVDRPPHRATSRGPET